MKMKSLPDYAQNLQRLVRLRGMTQAQVARASGLHRYTVSRCFNGLYMPTPPKLRAIAKALGVLPSDISPDFKDHEADEETGSGQEYPGEWGISKAASGRKDQVHLHVSMEVPMSIALKMVEMLQANTSCEEPSR